MLPLFCSAHSSRSEADRRRHGIVLCWQVHRTRRSLVPRPRVAATTSLFVLLGSVVGRADLVSETVVLVGETLSLLLECLNVLVLLLELRLQLRNLAKIAGLAELVRGLVARGGVTLESLVLLLKTQDVKDHDVGAVENERQEEGEAAKVHVALRVELASLYFHALRPDDEGAEDMSDWRFAT